MKNNNINFIEISKNKGFSGGSNVGIKYALRNKSEYILLLNNDPVIDQQLITRLVNRAKTDPSIGVVGSKIYFTKGYEYYKKKYKKSELGKVIWYAGGKIDWEICMHRTGGWMR